MGSTVAVQGRRRRGAGLRVLAAILPVLYLGTLVPSAPAAKADPLAYWIYLFARDVLGVLPTPGGLGSTAGKVTFNLELVKDGSTGPVTHFNDASEPRSAGQRATSTTTPAITETWSSHWWLKRDSMVVAPALGKATIDSGTQEKKQGGIDMAFKATSGPTKHKAGCVTTTKVTGKLTGTLKWVSGANNVGTIKETALPATMEKQVQTCTPPPRCVKGIQFPFVQDATGNLQMNALLSPAGSVGETWTYKLGASSSRPGPTTDVMTVAHAPSSWFTAANDLSSASLTTSGGGPPLTGTDTFATSGSPVVSSCNSKVTSTASPGSLSGDLTVHYDFSSAQSLTAGGAISTSLLQNA